MSYGKQNSYNTRNSGRFNTSGQFVAGGEQAQQYQPQFNNVVIDTKPKNLPPLPPLLQSTDVEMKDKTNSSTTSSVDGDVKPAWMKPKFAGVRKVSTKERRRRQNETLRRLLTPKNALMVLNEMTAVDNISQNFKVEQAPPPPNSYGYGFSSGGKQNFNFCADLTVDGTQFKGYGENKMMARNAAAEQAIRNIFLKKMNKLFSEGGEGSEGGAEEEPLPMIQLASFALQKLFTEWEYEGHKVPQLKPPQSGAEAGAGAAAAAGAAGDAAGAAGDAAGAGAAAEAAGARRGARAALPGNAAALHPCSLLSYMRPGLVYRELAVDGDTPQTVAYTMGVDLDGTMYIGKAQNKKEARRQAAKTACESIYKVVFDPAPTCNTPLPAPAPAPAPAPSTATAT